MYSVPEEVKDALRDGTYKKNWRIEVLADGILEAFVIDNNNLVSESVALNDHMCSSKHLQFGLCEGATLEFQYFGFSNITGRRVNAVIECEYKTQSGEREWFPIPMGYFTVDSCARQASTGIFRATCFNKLMSDYLDDKANTLIEQTFNGKTVTFGELRKTLLSEFEIKESVYEHMHVDYMGETEKPCGTNFVCAPGLFGNFPLNYAAVREAAEAAGQSGGTTRLYPRFISEIWGAEINPNRYYTLDSPYDLNEFEDYLYRKLNEEFTQYTSTLRILYGGNYVSGGGAEFVEKLKQKTSGVATYNFWQGDPYDGCQDFFGVRVTYEDGSVKHFSDKAKQLGYCQNNIQDIVNEPIFGAVKIELIIPREIRLYNYQTTVGMYDRPLGINYKVVYKFGHNEYKYYANADEYRADNRLDGEYNYVLPDGQETALTDFKEWAYPSEDVTKYAADEITVPTKGLSDITLRDVISSVYEMDVRFGRIDRVTDLFRGYALGGTWLYPSDTLYPNNELYPKSMSEITNKSMYSKLWADEGNVRSFKDLIITYKRIGKDGQEEEAKLQRVVNTHGTDNYNMSSNWIFNNLVWTSEQVGYYADRMAELLRGVRWFPFEMWAAGLPYLEAGDGIEININGNVYTSYIFERQIKGIHNLQDTYICGNLNIF